MQFLGTVRFRVTAAQVPGGPQSVGGLDASVRPWFHITRLTHIYWMTSGLDNENVGEGDSTPELHQYVPAI